MADYRKTALAYTQKGYSVIPVNAEKNPTLPTWTEYQKRVMTPNEIDKYFKDVWGIALLMGGSKKLTAIDIDLKYATVHDFFERFRGGIPQAVYNKFYVQKTKSGGVHFVFSADVVEKNQKLASRETTPEEKHVVYMNNFQDLRTRGKALKIASNHKSLVLIETRGEGGYILIAPSPNYEKIGGKIGHLSSQEYDELMALARSFNEVQEMHRDFKIERYRKSNVNPFEEYNERGDVLKILYENGWEPVFEDDKSVRLKRAGNPSSKSSALYDKETRVFNVFSTSTSFETNRGYAPASVFLHLEADGDIDVAREKLLALGFGEKLTNK